MKRYGPNHSESLAINHWGGLGYTHPMLTNGCMLTIVTRPLYSITPPCLTLIMTLVMVWASWWAEEGNSQPLGHPPRMHSRSLQVEHQTRHSHTRQKPTLYTIPKPKWMQAQQTRQFLECLPPMKYHQNMTPYNILMNRIKSMVHPMSWDKTCPTMFQTLWKTKESPHLENYLSRVPPTYQLPLTHNTNHTHVQTYWLPH